MNIEKLISDVGGRDEKGRRETAPKKKRRRKSPEAQIQKAIFDYLRLKGHFAWRNNVAVVPLNNGTGRFRCAGIPGSSDIFCLRKPKQGEKAVFYSIEVKSPTGRESEVQKRWGEKIVKAGGIYAVVRSVDDVMALGL